VACGEGGSEVLGEGAELQGDISRGAEAGGTFSCGAIRAIGFRFQVKGRTRIARITRMRFRIRCGMRNQGPFGGVGCKDWPLRLL